MSAPASWSEVTVARGNVPIDQDVLAECERLYAESSITPQTRAMLESVFG